MSKPRDRTKINSGRRKLSPTEKTKSTPQRTAAEPRRTANVPQRTFVETNEQSDFFDNARPNIGRFGWDNDHRNTNCSGRCRDLTEHFRVWRQAYEPYLEQLYTSFLRGINPSKVSFSEFSEFAYSYSSGYISPYA